MNDIMVIDRPNTALAPKLSNGINGKVAIRRQADFGGSGGDIPHIALDDIRLIAAAAVDAAETHRERDGLLVRTLFDGALRVSECLGLRPKDIERKEEGCLVYVTGKGGKRRKVAVSMSLVVDLQAYIYQKGILPDGPIFPVTRQRVGQIVRRAMLAAGIRKPEGVGSVHVLRHSGAIERLEATGNPKSVQDALGHSTIQMTMRYMKTLSKKKSLQAQQAVDFKW